MKFSANKLSHEIAHTIYMFNTDKELQTLDLSEQEREYLRTSFDDKQSTVASVNRYSELIYFVKINPKSSAAFQIDEACRISGNKLLNFLKTDGAKAVLIKNLASNLNSNCFAEGLALGSYQFLKYFSDADKKKKKLEEIIVDGASGAEISSLESIINGVFKARDLVNEPVNFLTATQLANEAVKAGQEYGFKVEVLNKSKIEALKMGGLLAVNKGSQDPPAFVIMEHKPENAVNEKPIVLVGKGVVYDTGGLSLKPTANSMDLMKSDMAGAAAVIGAMISASSSELPVHIIGLVPATDNRPGEKAYTPGDVIKMYDGSTVEVLNTDAEGRMILADALAYAKKYSPELVIDLATLTGAAAVAIGKYGIVAMGNASEESFDKLDKAGKEVYERLVQFPFWDEYNELLKSPIADVKNLGGREGGAITAGKFLERFTDYPYIHLDIAGPAFLTANYEYKPRGGTGVGVRLLFNYLKNLK